MFPNNPLVSKLVFQLAPAALVSAAGIVLLSSLARPVSAPQQAVPAMTAMKTEAVFTPTPRPAQPAPVVEQRATAAVTPRPAVKPNPQPPKVATTELPLPPPRQPAPVAVPSSPPAVPPAVAASNSDDRTIMGRLRGVTATVTNIPQQAYSKVSGWFADAEPPRPPAEIPAQNFKAAM